MRHGDQILWNLQWRDLLLSCTLREVRTSRQFGAPSEIGHYELRVVRPDKSEAFSVCRFSTRDELLTRSREIETALMTSGWRRPASVPVP